MVTDTLNYLVLWHKGLVTISLRRSLQNGTKRPTLPYKDVAQTLFYMEGKSLRRKYKYHSSQTYPCPRVPRLIQGCEQNFFLSPGPGLGGNAAAQVLASLASDSGFYSLVLSWVEEFITPFERVRDSGPHGRMPVSYVRTLRS